MRSLGILVTFAICAVAAITLSCSSTPANTPTPPAQTAATPAPSTDYLGAGVKMVGIRTASWQGDLYTVPFYTAVILQAVNAQYFFDLRVNEILCKPVFRSAPYPEV